MQNVPTEFENADVAGYPALPLMRQYILPEYGEVLVAADYNGQEMRLLAHFAEGKLAEIYNNDPRADIHAVAAEIVSQMAGMSLKRKQTKIVGFSLVYGSGIPHLAEGLGVPYEEARRVKEAYFRAMPGLKEFLREVSNRSEVRTWGGRIIPVEPSRLVNGDSWSFGYKLANHLIQGSAADQTKQSIIDYVDHRSHGSFLATVHDENVISVPVDKLAEEIALLRGSMERLPGFDVPFVAEVETGPNWADLKAYND
jgi:DNA polymerase-1